MCSRVPLRIVETDPAHADLIERLVRARLLTSDDGVVGLAHEALARAWPRLLDWLDDDIEGQRILRHLTGTADTWDAMGRPDTELYRGARLAQAVIWRERSRPHLTPTEQAFLDAGQALAESERQAAAERARHQARANRRLRALLSAAAIFLVVSIVAGLVAVGQRDRAARSGNLATARELAAAADANVAIDPERSILLALEAVDRTRTEDGSTLPEAEEALHRAVSASRIDLHVPGVGGRLDWSPDGTQFVTEGQEGSGVVDIRDARSGRSVQAFNGTAVDISDVAYNHDGTMLATTGFDTAARIWDPATGERLHTVRQPGYKRAWGVYEQGAVVQPRRIPVRGRVAGPEPRQGPGHRHLAGSPRDPFSPGAKGHIVRPDRRTARHRLSEGTAGRGRGCRVGRRCAHAGGPPSSAQ